MINDNEIENVTNLIKENETLKQENAEIKKNFEPYVRIVDSYGIANKILNQKIKQLETELQTYKFKSKPVDNKELFDSLYEIAVALTNGCSIDFKGYDTKHIEVRFCKWFKKMVCVTECSKYGCEYYAKLFIEKQKAKGR